MSSCKKEKTNKSTNPAVIPLIIETTLIPAGTFIMGSPESEPGRDNNEVQHLVTLSTFRMSKYEITNAQYAAFLNAKYPPGTAPNQALFGSNSIYGIKMAEKGWQPQDNMDNFPVVDVTWYGASEFAAYAGGRLPTEAEWEYACRGNTSTTFNTGNCLSNSQANYWWAYPFTGCINNITNCPGKTQAVNSYSPNAFGLYNMHGNVWEWCSDWYDAYPTTPQTNPTGPASGLTHVLRGGGWYSDAQVCRSAYRNYFEPDYFGKTGNYGFRLAFAP